MYVSMNPKGDIRMSRVTYERLGEPAGFVILFDGNNNWIGLKPAALATRNAYSPRKEGRYGAKVVRGYRTMQEFGIHLKETIRFVDAVIDQDGILILDLRTAKIDPRVSNHKQNRDRLNVKVRGED
jgi:hypothetical protein